MTYRIEGALGSQFLRWTLQDGHHRVGRSPGNQIVLFHRTVSREHAEIRVDGEKIEIEDLGSRNGTFVNGERVEGTAAATPGSQVRFGNVNLVLTGDEVTSPPKSSGEVRPKRAVEGTVLLERDQVLASTRVSWDDVQSELETGSFLGRSLFRVMAEAGALLVLPRTLDEVFDAILRMASTIIPGRRILILLQETEGAPPTIRAAWPAEHAAEDRILLSTTLLDAVLKGRESILITDAQLDPRFAGHASIVASQIRSALVAPLFDNERVLGLIYADTNDPTLHYDQDQLRAFTMFANLTAVKITNTRLLESEQEKERMEQEMATAARIQQSLLPPAIPGVEGYEIVAHQTPCFMIGGDLYDVAPLADETIGLAVGDVSGKGLGAALLMAHVMASLRLLYDETITLGEMMARIHTQVLRSSDASHFVTLFLGKLDPTRHKLQYVSAGHNPAIVIDTNGEVRTYDATGTPAGLIAGVTFGTESIDLPTGAIVCVYSDGVTEAQDEKDEYFGEERLIEALRKRQNMPLDEVLAGLLHDLRLFLGSTPANDDITLLLLRRSV
jgi:phosphoserine phosphatase RsbU/P